MFSTEILFWVNPYQLLTVSLTALFFSIFTVYLVILSLNIDTSVKIYVIYEALLLSSNSWILTKIVLYMMFRVDVWFSELTAVSNLTDYLIFITCNFQG